MSRGERQAIGSTSETPGGWTVLWIEHPAGDTERSGLTRTPACTPSTTSASLSAREVPTTAARHPERRSSLSSCRLVLRSDPPGSGRSGVGRRSCGAPRQIRLPPELPHRQATRSPIDGHSKGVIPLAGGRLGDPAGGSGSRTGCSEWVLSRPSVRYSEDGLPRTTRPTRPMREVCCASPRCGVRQSCRVAFRVTRSAARRISCGTRRAAVLAVDARCPPRRRCSGDGRRIWCRGVGIHHPCERGPGRCPGRWGEHQSERERGRSARGVRIRRRQPGLR